LIKHQYLKEGTVEVENDLFLSFVPESRLFQAENISTFEMIHGIDEVGVEATTMMTH